MKIFVTGGSGFVGSHLIPALVGHGDQVVALARSEAALAKVEALGAVGARGDITAPETLASALAGCEVVIHSAAAFDLWGAEAHFHKINVEGTANLLKAAAETGVKRFVFISAASVIAGGIPAHNVDEHYRLPAPPKDAYSKTKLAAEQLVLAANSSAMQTMALRPPLIWGAGHSMIAEIRAAAERGRWMWIGSGGHLLSTVHIDNLITAVLAAVEHGCGGEVYHVTDGETRPLRKFLTAWMAQEGIHLPNRAVPRLLALIGAQIMAGTWHVLRLSGQPPLVPMMVNLMGTEMTLNDSKARRELGYVNALSVDEALRMNFEG